MRYEPGEIVDILVEDAKVLESDENGVWVEYAAKDGTTTRCTIHLGKHVHVKRLVPAEGRPQDGEVWRDAHGARYVAVAQYGDFRGEVRLHDGQPGTGPAGWAVSKIHQERGPIRRVLAAPQSEPAGADGTTPHGITAGES